MPGAYRQQATDLALSVQNHQRRFSSSLPFAIGREVDEVAVHRGDEIGVERIRRHSNAEDQRDPDLIVYRCAIPYLRSAIWCRSELLPRMG